LLDRKTAADEERSRQVAFLATQIVNWSGFAKKPVKIEDFLKKRRRRKQTPEEMQEILIALNAALGGEVIK